MPNHFKALLANGRPEERGHNEILGVLLFLDENDEAKTLNEKQDSIRIKQEDKCDGFQPWKVCSDKNSHRVDLVSDDVFNLQKHLRRSNRLIPSIVATLRSQKSKTCSQNWICEEKLCRSRAQSGGGTEVKVEVKKDLYRDEFQHCSSPEGHIKRYRREVTFKIMKDSMALISQRKQGIQPRDNSVPICCSQVFSKFRAMKKNKKFVSTASFVCYDLNFEEKDGMQGELGCLRFRSIAGACEAKKATTQQNAESIRSFNIPSITLPSMKEILEYSVGKNPSEAKKSSRSQACDSGKKPKVNKIFKRSKRRVSNAKDNPSRTDNNLHMSDRHASRSKTFLNYLRPKLPQAAMPRKEKNFFACIMPINTNK